MPRLSLRDRGTVSESVTRNCLNETESLTFSALLREGSRDGGLAGGRLCVRSAAGVAAVTSTLRRGAAPLPAVTQVGQLGPEQ